MKKPTDNRQQIRSKLRTELRANMQQAKNAEESSNTSASATSNVAQQRGVPRDFVNTNRPNEVFGFPEGLVCANNTEVEQAVQRHCRTGMSNVGRKIHTYRPKKKGHLLGRRGNNGGIDGMEA